MMFKLKNVVFLIIAFLSASCHLIPTGSSDPVSLTINSRTGGVSAITIDGDSTYMNWVMNTDGSQYPWITESYGWGLGYFSVVVGSDTVPYRWCEPVHILDRGNSVKYLSGPLQIDITRREDNGIVETFTFINTTNDSLRLTDIGIYTPCNDNYPDAETCITSRANAHIWTGDNASYINMLRMGGSAPHLGLVVKEGALKGYEIWERGKAKGDSQTRGVIALNLQDMTLAPDESYTLSWKLFSHNGNDDFIKKMLENDGVIVCSERFVYETGDTARLILDSGKALKRFNITVEGEPVTVERQGNSYHISKVMDTPGEVIFDIYYNDGKHTFAECLVIPSIDTLIANRVNFIISSQRMKNPSDPRFGALMVYDNETDSIYLNDTPSCSPTDRDEGAERIGMGVLLAKQYRLSPSDSLLNVLNDYAHFLRDTLQTEDYKTFSSVDHKGRNRAYNYVWAADFYFQMYFATGERKYALDGYNTLKSYYEQFGNGFYAIGIPVLSSLKALKEAGYNREYRRLLKEYRKTAEIFVENGLKYPAHEVNYEQSIVAPALQFLCQMYLVTKDEKYLESVRAQLPALEAFNGFQPSHHLNDIALRHWDGYWFGKREMFGDTFPHYWSTATAAVFYYYSLCTGDENYLNRAREIVRNNLSLFTDDGRASCAFIYPERVNGNPGKFYDPYANDQDWALVYYYLVNKGI